ncbi:hypothetical protein V5799_015720 [Amblyomma americanum]|uniref:Uncharacterized protein n=1 Tax=Amblyomma americanum TaxID=6943 RepID=A0AAQ4F7U7_AMBAM
MLGLAYLFPEDDATLSFGSKTYANQWSPGVEQHPYRRETTGPGATCGTRTNMWQFYEPESRQDHSSSETSGLHPSDVVSAILRLRAQQPAFPGMQPPHATESIPPPTYRTWLASQLFHLDPQAQESFPVSNNGAQMPRPTSVVPSELPLAQTRATKRSGKTLSRRKKTAEETSK